MTIALISAIITLSYIILLRWIAIPLVYTTIGIVCALLGYGTYATAKLYSEKKDSTSLTLLIFFAVLLVVILLATLFLRKRIYLACQLIKEASK